MSKKSKHRTNRNNRGGVFPDFYGENIADFGEFLNRSDKIKHGTKTNVHHILNKCRRDDYNTEDARNKIRMLICDHDSYHRTFKNMTPQEIIEYIANLAREIIRPEVMRKIQSIVNLSPDEFYEDGLVK